MLSFTDILDDSIITDGPVILNLESCIKISLSIDVLLSGSALLKLQYNINEPELSLTLLSIPINA